MYRLKNKMNPTNEKIDDIARMKLYRGEKYSKITL